jgi:hypothetical protein
MEGLLGRWRMRWSALFMLATLFSCGRSESRIIHPPRSTDLGTCCLPRIPTEPVPTPHIGADGRPITVTWESTSYECASLTCVSYLGSEAYCTEQCTDSSDCDNGFTCLEVAPPINATHVGPWRVCVSAQLEQCITP